MPLKNVGPISADDSSNLNFNESYTLTLVRGDRRKGQSSAVTKMSDGGSTFGKPYDFVGTKTFGSVAGLRGLREDVHLRRDRAGLQPAGRACSSASARSRSR